MDANQVIQKLGLIPLPDEGGFYRQTYKAQAEISASALPEYSGARRHSTCIYYLITSKSFSRLHCLCSDEIWHFHAGESAQMVMLHPNGEKKEVRIGPDFLHDEQLQVVVPSGVFQGTRLIGKGEWALFSCTVAPGFEFDDTEVPERARLLELFPRHRSVIDQYT